MSLVWGWPLAFAALAALLVPLLLHLDRRRALRSLPFAAMRWIGDRHRPRRTWRLTEWLLLALRILLVAALALWLAQPLLRGWNTGQRWLAIVPGVATDAIAAAAEDVDRIVWLAPGFPEYDGSPPPEGGATASLLRELDSRLSPEDTLRVLVPTELGELDAARIALAHAIDWRVAAGAPAVPRTPALPSQQRVLALRYADADDASLPFLRAAIAAWAQAPSLAVALDEGPQTQPLPARMDALIWLGDAPDTTAREAAGNGATMLHIAAASAPVAAAPNDKPTSWPPPAQRLKRGRVVTWPTALDPDTLPELHSAEFPGMLHRMLFGEVPPPARAFADHVRPIRSDAPFAPRDTPLRPWFAWAIAALFLLERILANGPRRGAAA